MRFLPSLFIAVLICAALAFGLFFYSNIGTSNPSVLASPIPSTLSKIFYPAQAQDNFWMPNEKNSAALIVQKPDVQVRSALSYDLTTNTFLYKKNIDEKLPIASLTKLMTAVVALENQKEGDLVTVSQKAATIGEDSMGLSTGEKLTVKELLFGLFLQSGNDAAEALADASPYARDNFIHLMNKRAEDLGLTSTHFTNPTGLEGDGKQYSTAHDLLVITRYALQKRAIADVVQTYSYVIPYTSMHKEFDLYNETNLLTSYPGVKGVKTGFTDEAGLCLITYLDYGGHKIIAVLLNSASRRETMKELLDYSLKTLGVTPPQHG